MSNDSILTVKDIKAFWDVAGKELCLTYGLVGLSILSALSSYHHAKQGDMGGAVVRAIGAVGAAGAAVVCGRRFLKKDFMSFDP